MAENNETPTVTIEVEMADSSEEPEGSFESVIKVRITGSERHACELVKEAVLLAIQAALGDDESKDDHLPSPCISQYAPICGRLRGGLVALPAGATGVALVIGWRGALTHLRARRLFLASLILVGPEQDP